AGAGRDRPGQRHVPHRPRPLVPQPLLNARAPGADNSSVDRETCLSFDQQDPLSSVRNHFAIPDGIVYLDGNSLGALPAEIPSRIEQVVRQEWGSGLIRSWNDAGWMDAPGRVGDKIARLIGAQPGEVIVADSTSVNLFKLLAGALRLQASRHFILTETGNFPTDLYVAEGLVELLGGRHAVRQVDRSDIERNLDGSVAVLMLTHVDYTSGAILDMARITAAAHRYWVLALWDLSHSAGALPGDERRGGREWQARADRFVRLLDGRCSGFRLEVISPRATALRGWLVAVRHPQACPMIRPLIVAGVIGHFALPRRMRFGFAPL